MVAGFGAMMFKDSASSNSHSTSDQAKINKQLLNAIATLTENLQQVNQQLSNAGAHLDGSSNAIKDTTANNINNINSGHPPLEDDRMAISVPKPTQDFSKGAPDMIIINPTPEQNLVYEGLKSQLDDPSYLQNLSLMELKSLPEMQQLDGTMQMLILNKAVAKYNSGEISRDAFLAGMNATQ